MAHEDALVTHHLHLVALLFAQVVMQILVIIEKKQRFLLMVIVSTIGLIALQSVIIGTATLAIVEEGIVV